jgi:hypothetical protein
LEAIGADFNRQSQETLRVDLIDCSPRWMSPQITSQPLTQLPTIQEVSGNRAAERVLGTVGKAQIAEIVTAFFKVGDTFWRAFSALVK